MSFASKLVLRSLCVFAIRTLRTNQGEPLRTLLLYVKLRPLFPEWFPVLGTGVSGRLHV